MAILKEMKHSARFTQQPHAVLVLLLEQIHAAPSTPPKPFAVVYAADMAADALIDTGAILALLDRSDRWHRVCVDAFAELRLPLLTSEAVLTELFHLVGDSRVEMEAAWKFIRSGAVVLGSIEHAELPAVHTLMSRYRDRPMDFADATLVYLANRESLSAILTIDHADFATYRIQRNRGFRVLPAIRP
jgi:predicted nucleic acid-binding protein